MQRNKQQQPHQRSTIIAHVFSEAEQKKLFDFKDEYTQSEEYRSLVIKRDSDRLRFFKYLHDQGELTDDFNPAN
jgi:hypothetical protein